MRPHFPAILFGLSLLGCAGAGDPGDSFATFDTQPTGIPMGDGDGDLGTSGMMTTTGDGDGDPTTTTTTTGDPTTTTTGDPTTTTTTTTTGDGDGDGDIPPADMIDNFEDGDGALLPNGGRQGYWYTFNDETVGGTQTPAADMVLPEAGGANGTAYAIHTTGNGFTVWGAGMGIDFNNPGGDMSVKNPWDGSGYTGIVLMARGSGQVRASVQVSATTPIAEGGTCAADCDPHGTFLNLTNSWQQYVLPFGQLSQEGWGTPAAWDATALVGVQFKVGPNVSFDFWVDEIGFY